MFAFIGEKYDPPSAGAQSIWVLNLFCVFDTASHKDKATVPRWLASEQIFESTTSNLHTQDIKCHTFSTWWGSRKFSLHPKLQTPSEDRANVNATSFPRISDRTRLLVKRGIKYEQQSSKVLIYTLFLRCVAWVCGVRGISRKISRHFFFWWGNQFREDGGINVGGESRECEQEERSWKQVSTTHQKCRLVHFSYLLFSNV